MRYAVYDVFTDTPFAGNPLAVVLDGGDLSTDRMQAVAREFGFSETTFVLPDAGGATPVRIFTPDRELPFAGHPVIGTAVALSDEGGPDARRLTLGIGPVETRVTRGDGVPGAAFDMTARPTVTPWDDAALAAGLAGLAPGDLAGPVEVASLGLPFLMAQLTSADALVRARPDAAAAARLVAAGGPTAGLFWIRDGDTVRQRMFAPAEGIAEDPATGSAAATLAAVLAMREGQVSLTCAQGAEMGRPSTIRVTGNAAADGTVALTVAGQAVRVMEGRLTL